MHSLKTAYITLLALGATMATAIPAPAPAPDASLKERTPSACTTVAPDFARVSEAEPVQSYLPGFIIDQDANGENKNDMFIEFSIPEGSWGCTLEYYFPAGYEVDISGDGTPPVDVYSVQGPLSRSPRGIDISWAYCPAPQYIAGTTRFESSPDNETKRVINSFACADTMTYRLSIVQWYSRAGGVEFDQTADAGLRMTHNC